jgi:hypothetical protein
MAHTQLDKVHTSTVGGLNARERVYLGIQEVDRIALDFDEANGTFDVPRSNYEFKPASATSLDQTEETHESFGVIEVTRPSGHTRLVGTVVDSLPNFIRLSVYRSVRCVSESLHTEHYYHRGLPIADVHLSTHQWAEMISSLNGVPVPCTLKTVHGVSMSPVPEEVKTIFERTIDDASKKMGSQTQEAKDAEASFEASVEGIIAAVESLGLSKTKAATVTSLLKGLVQQHIKTPKTTLAWAVTRLNEESEKMVSNARLEIAASIESLVRRSGIKALNEGSVDVKALLGAKE